MATPIRVPLPHATRSQVFTALYNLLLTTPPPTGLKWETTSQHLVIWDDVPQAAQPALFLWRGPQDATQKTANGVTKWLWTAIIFVYYRTDNMACSDTSFPEQLVDDFIDNLEQTFQTDPLLGRLTLNGTVWHCFIDGKIIFDPGLVDNQGVIAVPLSIYL